MVEVCFALGVGVVGGVGAAPSRDECSHIRNQAIWVNEVFLVHRSVCIEWPQAPEYGQLHLKRGNVKRKLSFRQLENLGLAEVVFASKIYQIEPEMFRMCSCSVNICFFCVCVFFVRVC